MQLQRSKAALRTRRTRCRVRAINLRQLLSSSRTIRKRAYFAAYIQKAALWRPRRGFESRPRPFVFCFDAAELAVSGKWCVNSSIFDSKEAGRFSVAAWSSAVCIAFQVIRRCYRVKRFLNFRKFIRTALLELQSF